jgi:hypothetical protein
MSRGRLIPSLIYRSKGLVDMVVHNANLRGIDQITVYGASNLNDAYNNPVEMFSVPYDRTFRSSFITAARLGVEETQRDQTRFVFNPNEYSTTFKANTPRIPTDDETLFLRVRGRVRATQENTDLGPVVGVVPYDFYSVTAPVFTVIGNAPNLDSGVNIPDTLSTGALNFHLPNFSQTINMQNLDSPQGGSNLFISFNPGMPPSILRPGESLTLTSGAVGEFYLAGQTGTPLFTIRCSVVNRG